MPCLLLLLCVAALLQAVRTEDTDVNHVTARVGDNVEIKCDVGGTPAPPVAWRRNDVDLAALDEDEIKVFADGSLYLTSVQLIHAGNYTCRALRRQTHVLRVHSVPWVRVRPRLQCGRPGAAAAGAACRAAAHPAPRITWLKNDERMPPKCKTHGNGTGLLVPDLSYSDTGAYMCVADSAAGAQRDIASLVVQDDAAAGDPPPERRLLVFGPGGAASFSAAECRAGGRWRDGGGGWGGAAAASGGRVYATRRDSLLVFSRDATLLHSVRVCAGAGEVRWSPPHAWVRCAGDAVAVVRDDKLLVRTLDKVSALFLPAENELGHAWKYGYAVHAGLLTRLHLGTLRYAGRLPLRAECTHAAFAPVGGHVVLGCVGGQVVLDAVTGAVTSRRPSLRGAPFVTPDSGHCVTVNDERVTLQQITEDGLRWVWERRGGGSPPSWFPSRAGLGHDLLLPSSPLLVLELSGALGRVPGADGSRGVAAEAGPFARYAAAAGDEAVFVVDGTTRSVNCEIRERAALVVWPVDSH